MAKAIIDSKSWQMTQHRKSTVHNDYKQYKVDMTRVAKAQYIRLPVSSDCNKESTGIETACDGISLHQNRHYHWLVVQRKTLDTVDREIFAVKIFSPVA